MSETMKIRVATSTDARSIAAMQLAGWRHVYSGLMPAAAMAALSLDRREQSWRAKLLSPPSPDQRVWVAEQEGEPLGFIATLPSRDRDADPRRTAELHSIYVRPDLSGRGIGRTLFSWAVDDARRRCFEELTLWVVEANRRARRFYEAEAMVPDGGTRTEMKDTAALVEVRYRRALATPSKGTP